MNLFVHVIFQTTILGAPALQTGSPSWSGSDKDVAHRSALRSSSIAVLDSAGEAALTLAGEAALTATGEKSPLPVASDTRSAELASEAESPPESPKRHARDTTEKAEVIRKQQVAAPHKLARSVRTPLTLTQLLDAGGKSALSNFSRLVRAGSHALAKMDSWTLLLPIFFCFIPAFFILAAMTAPMWNRRARQASPLAAAAMLDQKQSDSDGYRSDANWQRPKPSHFSGDAWDMDWRASQAQERPILPSEPVESVNPDRSGPRFMMQGAMALFGDFGHGAAQRPVAIPNSQSQGESDLLCPQMLIQEPTGAQFMLDGFLAPYEQKSFVEVRRNNSNARETEVLHCHLSEEPSDGGIILEWPVGRLPICFMGTSTAVSRKGLPPPRDRFVTLVPCSTGPFRASMPPFAIVKAVTGGFEVRRYGTNKVLLRIITGGFNVDYANIVDPGGRLMASMSLRGQSVKNRRVITMAQGVDAVLVVCAVIASTKLA